MEEYPPVLPAVADGDNVWAVLEGETDPPDPRVDEELVDLTWSHLGDDLTGFIAFIYLVEKFLQHDLNYLER